MLPRSIPVIYFYVHSDNDDEIKPKRQVESLKKSLIAKYQELSAHKYVN